MGKCSALDQKKQHNSKAQEDVKKLQAQILLQNEKLAKFKKDLKKSKKLNDKTQPEVNARLQAQHKKHKKAMKDKHAEMLAVQTRLETLMKQTMKTLSNENQRKVKAETEVANLRKLINEKADKKAEAAHAKNLKEQDKLYAG